MLLLVQLAWVDQLSVDELEGLLHNMNMKSK